MLSGKVHMTVQKILLGSRQFSRLPRTTEVCNFPFFLQMFEVIWETTANLGETLPQSCAEKYEGFFALYRMTFDLVLRKL